MNPESWQKAAQLHRDLFQSPAVLISQAPGRVNLIGEHVDYCDGLVLPLAIDRHTLLAGASCRQPVIRIHSTLFKETVEIPLQASLSPAPPAWCNYVRGVIQSCFDRGMPRVGWTAVVDSDLPAGAGLSSSAALLVAVAGFLERISGVQFDRKEKALLCQEAEHRFAGVPCGFMDQFTSVFGEEDRLLLIDCSNQALRWVPFDSKSAEILVINTQVRHELSTGEYAARHSECARAAHALGTKSLRTVSSQEFQSAQTTLEPLLRKRARHVISEIERTRNTAKAIEAGDWRQVGDWMRESHRSLRDDFEVSCSELDAVHDICKEISLDEGMIGCRMTGGGFGGSCIALIRPGKSRELIHRIGTQFQEKTGKSAAFLLTKPSAGALTEDLNL